MSLRSRFTSAVVKLRAVGTLGLNHIVFGSDYPVRRDSLGKGVATIRSAQIPPEEKDRILGGNLADLLRLGSSRTQRPRLIQTAHPNTPFASFTFAFRNGTVWPAPL